MTDPHAHTVHITEEDAERARAALERAGAEYAELATQFVAACRPVAEHLGDIWRQIADTLRPVIEYYEQHPEELERWEREREAEAQLGSCHCLCGTHPDQPGICASTATPGLEITYNSPTVGTQRVKHCRPCWEAKNGQRLPALPSGDAYRWSPNDEEPWKP